MHRAKTRIRSCQEADSHGREAVTVVRTDRKRWPQPDSRHAVTLDRASPIAAPIRKTLLSSVPPTNVKNLQEIPRKVGVDVVVAVGAHDTATVRDAGPAGRVSEPRVPASARPAAPRLREAEGELPGGSVPRPRWARMRRIGSRSVMTATTRSRPWHLGHSRASTDKLRRSSVAQSTRG